jgi:hypothetical protein
LWLFAFFLCTSCKLVQRQQVETYNQQRCSHGVPGLLLTLNNSSGSIGSCDGSSVIDVVG